MTFYKKSMLLTFALLSFVCQPLNLKTEESWKAHLGEKRYAVMRLKQREKAFLGTHVHEWRSGIYSCAACRLPLFSSQDKYLPGAGWPSFTSPLEKKNIEYTPDLKGPVQRYFVSCACCKSHLGHVFHDGPPPKQLRYCIQSLSLDFYPSDGL